MDDKELDPETTSNDILSVLDTKHAVKEVELENKNIAKENL